MRSKNIVLILVLALCFIIVTACSNNKPNETKQDEEKVSAEAEEKELKKKKELEEEKKAKEKEEKKKKQAEKEKKKKEKQKKKPEVKEASGTYYVTAPSLNVRKGDGTEYDQLGSLSHNEKVTVTGKTTNDWYEFDYKDQKGYASGNYLSSEKQVVADKEKSDENKKENSNKSSQSKKSSNSNEEKSTSSNDDNQNVVDKITNLGNSQQVILVTTKGYGTSSAQIRTFDKDSNGKWTQRLNSNGHIGKNGFTDNKVEGDGKSPTGKYSIGHAFGYQGNPGTKLNFKSASSNDVWVDDSNSKYYNTWQQKDNKNKDWDSAEDMTHRLYNYGFVINYNTNQTPDKGSAIFMHVGSGHTVGCTATNQGDLIKIMQWIDPGKNPVIIQTPEAGLGNY